MRPKRLFGHLGALVAACGAMILPLTGCLSASEPRDPVPMAPAAPPPDAGVISALLELMSALPQGDPASQAELFESTKNAAESSPTSTNRLRYALALATPNFGGSDPVAAQRQLAELLARPETLLPAERYLAVVQLREVEQRLILQAENKRMRDEPPREESHDKLQALSRRLTAESDENARLRKALDEARAKLEAVTHVERSINDRGTNGSRTP